MWRSHFLTAYMCREIAVNIEMDEPEEMYLMFRILVSSLLRKRRVFSKTK